MTSARHVLIVLALGRSCASAARDMCTAVLVGKGATVDGSTMTTHNADCLNCDYRLARTSAKDHPEVRENSNSYRTPRVRRTAAPRTHSPMTRGDQSLIE